MPVTIYESFRSRDIHIGPDTVEVPIELVVHGAADEDSAVEAVLDNTSPMLFDLFRKDLKVRSEGPGLTFVTLLYQTGDETEAIYPEGATDVPGSEGGPPPVAPGADDPLDTNVRGTIGGGTVHITQSLDTVASYGANGATPPETNKAIGLNPGEGTVEGCDIPAGGMEFTVSRKRRTATLTYLRKLGKLCSPPKTNKATFWTYAAGELLYLGADFDGNNRTGFTFTHKFRFVENWPADVEGSPETNDPRNQIAPGLRLTGGKKGHDYVWVGYAARPSGTQFVFPTPLFAKVERVFGEGDFAQLEIGT